MLFPKFCYDHFPLRFHNGFLPSVSGEDLPCDNWHLNIIKHFQPASHKGIYSRFWPFLSIFSFWWLTQRLVFAIWGQTKKDREFDLQFQVDGLLTYVHCVVLDVVGPVNSFLFNLFVGSFFWEGLFFTAVFYMGLFWGPFFGLTSFFTAILAPLLVSLISMTFWSS